MARRITKPQSVRDDPYRSKKWNEIVRGRSFRPSDVPALTLLVQWYQIVDQCMEDLSGAIIEYSARSIRNDEFRCDNGQSHLQHLAHV